MKPKALNTFSCSNFRPAFTLVELLIVVVIIGVLAGLMFPMIRSMRSRADVTKCAGNLRVWSLVIRSYASEHNQMVRYEEWEDIGTGKKFYNPYFGSEETWLPQKKQMGATLGYHRMCPSQKWDGSGSPPRGYLFTRPNEFNADTGKYVRGEVDLDRTKAGGDHYSLTKITRPSQMLMMMDANNYKNIYRTSELTEYVKPVCINSDKTQIRHGGGVNALFADGHVDFLNWSDIDPGRPENTQKVTTWLNLD